MSLTLIFIIIFTMLTLLVIVGAYILVSWLRSMQLALQETKNSLVSTLNQNTQSVNGVLSRQTADIYDRLTAASQVIAELKKEAGAFSEVSRSMQELHQYLKSPKLRGNLGESVLNDLLSQIFPKSNFSLQYTFKSGEKVDAVIRTDAGLLPIDSKFPLENFAKYSSETNPEQRILFERAFWRDIKKHLTDIATKYILPAENTLDFALMYIPSESVYYEVASNTQLMATARQLRVYPVSPNTLYAALQTILLSFEGKKIESRAKEVITIIRSLEKDFQKVTQHLQTLGTHLNSANNKYAEVQSSFLRLGQKLDTSHLIEESHDAD